MLGIGIAGCGEVVRARHLPVLRRIRSARVVALADPDPAARRETAAAAPGARVVAQTAELLDDPAIDAVLVATPPALHADVAVEALDSGRHVLCEKPLALDVPSCGRIAEAAAASGRVATVGFNLRHHPAVKEVRDAVASGGLGRPELVQSRSTSGRRRGAGAWLADPSRGGGILFEQAVHHVDLWRFILGDELAEIHVKAAGPEQAAIVATTEGGTLISGAFSWRTGPENKIAVFGPRARAAADLYTGDPAVVLAATANGGEPGARVRRAGRTIRSLPRVASARRLGGVFNATYLTQWRSFLAAARGRQANPCPATEGAAATAAIRSMMFAAGLAAPEAAGAA